MNVLEVRDLTKRYPAFTLDKVSFSVGKGRVVGLIGANGAGKSTTLKSITGLIASEGEVNIFGKDFRAHEREIKSQIGYVGGGFRYYVQHTVGSVVRAVAPCYPQWDEALFRQYLKNYGIDPKKRIGALSEGMKVKFYLALALSHGARLLILDEPTSGLDPLSREDFCDTVLALVIRHGVSVLFSTHVTSDLERIADDVVMLSNGSVLIDDNLENLTKKYRTGYFSTREAAEFAGAIGIKRTKNGFAGLLACGTCERAGNGEDKGESGEKQSRPATLDEIMVHLEIQRRGESL